MAVLVAVRGDFRERYRLGTRHVVGRGPTSDIRIQDALISRHHAEIFRREDGRYEIVDLKSRYGLFVNQQRVGKAWVLTDGDEIIMGGLRFEFFESRSDTPASVASISRPARRADCRIAYSLPVRVRTAERTIDARSVDISLGGIAIEAEHLSQAVCPGDIVRVAIAFPGRWARRRLAGQVLRVTGDRVAIRFSFAREKQRAKLAERLAMLEEATAVSAKETPDSPAASVRL